MSKIKIVYFVTFVKNVGVYNIVSNMINSINKEKYDVTLIACLNSNDRLEIKRIENLGVKFISLDFENKIMAILQGPKQLEKILKNIKPNIVHSHAILADYILANTPGSFKKITTIHCNIWEDYKYHYGLIISKLYVCLHLTVLKKFDKIIGCSRSVYDSLKKGFKEKATYVLNGIDAKKGDMNIDLKKKFDFNDEDYIYIYIGSINKRKNVMFLIKEFEKYHIENEKLLVIGNGALLEKCKKQNCKDVLFLGQIDNPIDYIKQSDVYISASKSEGMSVSLIEALENGLYIFLSNIDSHNEIFEIDKKCYLGESFEKNTFKNKMEKLRKKLKEENSEEIKNFKNNNLSALNMISKYCKVYEEK